MSNWDFCTNSLVVVNEPPQDAGTIIDMNGWIFAAKPKNPWQYTFNVTVYGLRWYTYENGIYDNTTDAPHNARRFEEFVEEHGCWKPFLFPHPELGTVETRFKRLPTVPAGAINSNGIVEPFEMSLVHSKPNPKNIPIFWIYPPTPSSLAEGSGSGSTPFTFRVMRTGLTSYAAAVDWASSGISAGLDSTDFVGSWPLSGTLNFAAGQTTATITINVNKDATIEGNESFKIALSNPRITPSGVPGRIDLAEAIAVILDDDNIPSPPGTDGVLDFTSINNSDLIMLLEDI